MDRLCRRACVGLLLVAFAGAVAGCSAQPVVGESGPPKDYGRDGWRRATVEPDRVEALRSRERVVIRPGDESGTFVVSVIPRSLPFPTPWGANPVAAFEPAGLTGEHRVYYIPYESDWNAVREWYVGWFDFRPGADKYATDPKPRPIPGVDD